MNNIYRKTYAEINLKNLYQNYANISSLLNNKMIIPVVKANAYGHGVIEVVEYLISNNITYFAVSLLEEALELRKRFNGIKILVMGVVDKEYFEIASNNNVILTISNFDQLKDFDNFKIPLTLHLKIDTGMNRLGFKTQEDIVRAFNIIENSKYVFLEGIYTHFATADADERYYNKQLTRFNDIVKLLDYNFKEIHVSNSSSMIKYENDISYTTHTRLGISLYGLTLDKETKFLQNTYKLISYISEIKNLSPGDKVGYGATYTAMKEEIIGILPIGYADGFIRQNQSGDVEIKGKRYSIIGRICMDQMFIKIDKTITKSDKVILFGGLVSIDEVAKRLDTINYEIICQITYRVPKIYIK